MLNPLYFRQSKESRRVCDLNPACIWSWFEDQCECLSNPCESEYCEQGYPSCRCSSLLCDEEFSKQFSNSCFLQNSNTEHDDACICQNKHLDFNRYGSIGMFSQSKLHVDFNPRFAKQFDWKKSVIFIDWETAAQTITSSTS